MLKKLLFSMPLIIVTSISKAEQNNCERQSTQIAMNKCSSLYLDSKNKEIGAIYNNYLLKLDTAQKTKLKESQRLWVQFKEKDCAFESSPLINGSLHSYVLSQCLINRTEKRISELRDMMNCENGTEPGCK